MIYLRSIRLLEKPKKFSYLYDIPAIAWLCQQGGLDFNQPVTFFVGENGTGKSTLLEAIAVLMGLNAEGGSRDFSFSTRDSHSELCNLLKPIKSYAPYDGFFLRAESFYNAATYLEDVQSEMDRYGGVPFHEQSHGEAVLSLVSNRFEGKGLYLLDEPESALSPQRLMSLMVEVARLEKGGSQFIISTHSPILMTFPNAEIYQFSESGIAHTRYQDTSHFQITKEFLNHPERMLHHLLDGL